MFDVPNITYFILYRLYRRISWWLTTKNIYINREHFIHQTDFKIWLILSNANISLRIPGVHYFCHSLQFHVLSTPLKVIITFLVLYCLSQIWSWFPWVLVNIIRDWITNKVNISHLMFIILQLNSTNYKLQTTTLILQWWRLLGSSSNSDEEEIRRVFY